MKEERKVKPYDELDEVGKDRCPCYDEDLCEDNQDEDELDDLYLDPGFASWNDYYQYKFG